MKTNKERLVLGGVLGVAALGLAVDRLFLDGGFSGPQSAVAEVSVPRQEAATEPTEVVVAPTPMNMTAESLSERFERFKSESGLSIDDIGDAMSDNGRLVQLKETPELVQTDWVERFKANYELCLVMGAAGGPYTAYLKVVADPNRTIRVREGGVIDEFTLERIDVDSTTGGAVAHFAREGRTVELSRSNSP